MNVGIVRPQGFPLLEIDGERFAPLMFRSFRPTPANILLFRRAGIRLYQMLVSGGPCSMGMPYSLFGGVWTGPGQYDFTNFDRQMKMFRDFAPDAYFNVMFQLDTPKWWHEAHPDVPDSYRNLGIAATSEVWRHDTTELLRAFLAYSERVYGEQVFGYTIAAGFATEWFTAEKGAGHPLKEAAYRHHLNDETAHVPTAEELDEPGDTIRDPSSNQAVYLKYCNELIGELLCHYAREAQAVLNHRKLLGAYHCYLRRGVSWAHNLWGANAHQPVLECPDLDIICAPAAYGAARMLDGASSYQVPTESLEVNGKLYLHEIDHRTHLAAYPLEHGGILGDCFATEDESLMVLRREVCAALAKKGAIWWFDFFGGYYAAPAYEAELKKHIEVYNRVLALPYRPVDEIAVIADPMAFLLLKERVDANNDYGPNNLDNLHHCGADFAVFELSDLEKIDVGRFRMFVFLNTFVMSEQTLKFISEKLAGKLKCFVHAPNYAGGGTLDVEGIRRVTGMQVARFEAEGNAKASFAGVEFGFTNAVSPMFEVVDPEAETLCRFTDGKVAVARKGDTVYSALGNIPWQLWRALAMQVGIHCYTDHGDCHYATTRWVAYQTTRTEEGEIQMPSACELEELFDGGTYKTDSKGLLRFRAPRGRCMLFLSTANERTPGIAK
ncbi:MAG: hypothetical protein PHR35_11985 [Kiritimatiellae bacterium]|nr:hypothetical protein [Kiritimatiellia bacterium]